MRHVLRPVVAVTAVLPLATLCFCEESMADQIVYEGRAYPLFPETLAEAPQIPSPLVMQNETEILTGFTLDGRWFIVPVTVENGAPLDYSSNQWWGKGRQLAVDSTDFPTLARTGLHSDAELDTTETITGKPVSEITRIGRPQQYSGAGFMSDDEDIISVLKGDNELVRQMGLTHADCARPLFHVFNVIQSVKKDSERGSEAGVLYNGREVHLKFWGAKGWQESIFDDEILGYWQIEMRRELDQAEQALLSSRYLDLTEDEMAELVQKLSYIHTGEMVPFYIMRYGFYEGHTSYRADPIAIACIFGLRSMDEIASAFEDRLYEALTSHFSNVSNRD
jgi:hypothetical protein